MRNELRTSILLITIIFVHIGCEKAKERAIEDDSGDIVARTVDPSDLVGTWLFESPTATLRYTFTEDGMAFLIEEDITETMEREGTWWIEGNVLFVSSQAADDGSIAFDGATIFVTADRLYVDIFARTSHSDGLDGKWFCLEMEGETKVAEDGVQTELREEWSLAFNVQGDKFDSVEKVEIVDVAAVGTRRILQADSITGSGTLRITQDAVHLTYEQASYPEPFYAIGKEQLLGYRVDDEVIAYTDNPEDTVDDLCFKRVE